MTVKQVCVIGAGVSGLVSAKTFLEEGYEVTLFEKRQGLGGVWERSRTYPGLSIQNPRDTYAFSDYPMPASYPEWPSGEQICAYLESYAQHFGVAEKIQFGAKVTKVERKSGNTTGWMVSVSFQENDREIRKQNYEFDFVIVCNGICDIPYIPNLPGMEEFIAGGEQGTIHLYRHLIHPHVPQMGFVGYNYTFCAQLSAEIGARWLSEYVKGSIPLPSQQQMLQDVTAELEWRKKDRPYAFVSGACVIPFTLHYIDELLQDMGLSSRRQPGNLIGEFLMPIDPSAYKHLRQELQVKQHPSLNDSAIASGGA
jgi:hypothetical protein